MKVLLGDRGAHPAVIAEYPVMRWRPLIKSIVWGPEHSRPRLSGCVESGAPSSPRDRRRPYFPGWMFCGLIGIVLAIAARIGFVASGLAGVLPFQLFVCTAIGLSCGVLAWLLWFGQ